MPIQARIARILPAYLLLALVAGILPLGCSAAQDVTDSIQDEVRTDPGWPREYSNTEGQRLLAFQPQVESWDDYTRLTMRLAVALSTSDGGEPIYGAVHASADTETDLEERTVVVFNFELHEATFPGIAEDSSAVLLDIIRTTLPDASRTIALDRILAYMDQPLLGPGAEGLSVEPPVIFVSETPARLLLFDGEPILSPIDGTDLMYALNTNWELFLVSGESSYYLRDESVWYVAGDYTGPWQASEELPEDLQNLPDDGNWENVKASFPATFVMADQVPEIFVSTTPAELIALDGPPELMPIEGTRLLSVENTEQDLFFHTVDARYYFLVSGRWFATEDLGGEWVWVAELPEDFASIPPDHAYARVLASVPGTPQAAEAVLQAQIPQKATVDRSQVEVEVSYTGEPEFNSIDGTGMSYAVNTSSDVIQVGGSYYLCHQGVWFVSSTPAGPWALSESVPDQIYTIPASSPVYHTTYVYVYDSTPTTVTYGYTAGYTGMFILAGVVIWGTGYHYDPWYYYGGAYRYPVYYPRPYSYGAATWYNPTTGVYGRGAAHYGPYGGYGAAAAYNPHTGAYSRGAAAYGPYGGTRVREAYNPNTGAYGASRQSRSPYAQWGSSVVTQGDDWAYAQHYSDSRGTVGSIQGSEGGAVRGVITDEGSAFRGVDADGDVYAGRDGNVYRRDEDGWSQYDDGDWNRVDPDEADARRGEVEDRRGEREAAGQERGDPAARQEALGARDQGDPAARQEALRSAERGGLAAGRNQQSLGGQQRSDLTRSLERDRNARMSGNARTNNWNSRSRGSTATRRRSAGGGRRRR